MVQNFLNEGDHREVFYFDEGRFGLKVETEKQWGKRGETLHTRVSGFSCQLLELFVISTVSQCRNDEMNVYLAELSKTYPDREMLMISDRAGWYHSHQLEIPPNIQVHLLPPYSP